MTTYRFRKKPVATTLLIAALALSGTTATAGAAHAEPASATDAPKTELDYFAQNIEGLPSGSVFEAVTYERFETLLQREGTYALLVGGPSDPRVQAAAPSIDAAATKYGVEKVYAFDPLLDGVSVDVRTSQDAEIAKIWSNLLTSLNADTTPQFGVGNDPYLVIYDKSHTEGGSEDRVIASLTAATTDDGYDEALDAVFASVALDGKAAVDTQSQFDFFRGQMNSRHQGSYKDASLYGAEILSEDQAADFVLKSITYPELVELLETPGDHTILFGGTWCHNTRAVAHEINDKAIEAGIDTVYVFDLRLDSQYVGNRLHIRDNADKTPLSYLYGDLVSQYLPGLRTQYQLTSENAGHKVSFYPGGDSSQALSIAPKLQVPYLVQYNNGSAAPVTKDWVQIDQAGAVKEFMTEFWWVEGLPGGRNANRYPATPDGDAAWATYQQDQWSFAEAALAELDVFFGLDEDAGEGDTDASGGGDAAGSADGGVDGGANSEAGSTANGDPKGETGADGAPVTPSAELRVSGDLRPGASFTLACTDLPAHAEVRIELHSTPQLLGSSRVGANGVLTFSGIIPAATPAGTHHIVVFADGRELARVAVAIAGTNEQLATTGAEEGVRITIGVAALALIAAGVSLILVRRKQLQATG